MSSSQVHAITGAPYKEGKRFGKVSRVLPGFTANGLSGMTPSQKTAPEDPLEMEPETGICD